MLLTLRCMAYGLQALRRSSLIHGLPSPEGTRVPPLWRQPLGASSSSSQMPGGQLAQLLVAWSPSLYWPFPVQCPGIGPLKSRHGNSHQSMSGLAKAEEAEEALPFRARRSSPHFSSSQDTRYAVPYWPATMFGRPFMLELLSESQLQRVF